MTIIVDAYIEEIISWDFLGLRWSVIFLAISSIFFSAFKPVQNCLDCSLEHFDPLSKFCDLIDKSMVLILQTLYRYSFSFQLLVPAF